MKRILTLIIFTFLSYWSNAQSVTKINLSDWKGKKEAIPFAISTINVIKSNPQVIGTAELSKKKKTRIEFRTDTEDMIEKFVSKNFDQGSDMEVQMDIEVLEIKKVAIKGKETPHLLFSCKFYKQSDLQEHLYVFNARNSVPKKKSLKASVTNYVSRAINSAILNFKKAALQHPEWNKSNPNTPNVAVSTQVLYNKFENLGDTISLDGKYKLQDADYSGIVADGEKDEAYSFFMLTYTLDVIDTKNKIALKVLPKAFFLRSKSWSKKSDSTNWKEHQQLLFDLASYHGLNFKQELEKQEFSPGFYKAEVNKIYNKINEAYFDEMDQLQAETLYGAYKDKQKEWRVKIDQYLKKVAD